MQRKKKYAKSYFEGPISVSLEILNTRHCLLIKQFIAIIIPTFIVTLGFSSEKNKIL